MNFEYLKYFVETYRCGSLYQAAKEIYISPQGISQGIKRLEDSLGMPLFDRTQNGLEATAFGKEFYVRAEKAVGEMDSLESFAREYRAIRENTISVALMGYNTFSYLMLNMIEHFQNENPDCRIGTRIYEANQYDLVLNRLVDGTLDVAWTFHTKKSEMFNYITIRDENLQCLLSGSSPLRDKEYLEWSDLVNECFIMPPKNEAFPSLILSHCKTMGCEPRRTIYSTETMFISKTIASGSAVGIFYRDYLNTLRQLSPDTVAKDVRPPLQMTLSLFYNKKHEKNEIFTQFLNYAEKYLKSNLRDW